MSSSPPSSQSDAFITAEDIGRAQHYRSQIGALQQDILDDERNADPSGDGDNNIWQDVLTALGSAAAQLAVIREMSPTPTPLLSTETAAEPLVADEAATASKSTSSDESEAAGDRYVAQLPADYDRNRRNLEAQQTDLSASAYRATTPLRMLSRAGQQAARLDSQMADAEDGAPTEDDTLVESGALAVGDGPGVEGPVDEALDDDSEVERSANAFVYNFGDVGDTTEDSATDNSTDSANDNAADSVEAHEQTEGGNDQPESDEESPVLDTEVNALLDVLTSIVDTPERADTTTHIAPHNGEVTEQTEAEFDPDLFGDDPPSVGGTPLRVADEEETEAEPSTEDVQAPEHSTLPGLQLGTANTTPPFPAASPDHSQEEPEKDDNDHIDGTDGNVGEGEQSEIVEKREESDIAGDVKDGETAEETSSPEQGTKRRAADDGEDGPANKKSRNDGA